MLDLTKELMYIKLNVVSFLYSIKREGGVNSSFSLLTARNEFGKSDSNPSLLPMLSRFASNEFKTKMSFNMEGVGCLLYC